MRRSPRDLMTNKKSCGKMCFTGDDCIEAVANKKVAS